MSGVGCVLNSESKALQYFAKDLHELLPLY